MPVPVPTGSTRWRCALCGNLTRFDVRRSTRSREFVHVSLAGEAVVEDRQVVAETVEQVTCRWCGRSDSVELVSRPGEPGAPEPADVPAGAPGPADPADVRGPADVGGPADVRGPADVPSEPAEHPAGS